MIVGTEFLNSRDETLFLSPEFLTTDFLNRIFKQQGHNGTDGTDALETCLNKFLTFLFIPLPEITIRQKFSSRSCPLSSSGENAIGAYTFFLSSGLAL